MLCLISSVTSFPEFLTEKLLESIIYLHYPDFSPLIFFLTILKLGFDPSDTTRIDYIKITNHLCLIKALVQSRPHSVSQQHLWLYLFLNAVFSGFLQHSILLDFFLVCLLCWLLYSLPCFSCQGFSHTSCMVILSSLSFYTSIWIMNK